jgi:hypothetical protein
MLTCYCHYSHRMYYWDVQDMTSTFESVTVNFLVRADKKRAPYMQKPQRARAKLRGMLGLAANVDNAAATSETREGSQSMPPHTDSQRPTKVVLPPQKGDVPLPFHAVADVPRPTPLPLREPQEPQPWEKRRPTHSATQQPVIHTSVVNTR